MRNINNWQEVDSRRIFRQLVLQSKPDRSGNLVRFRL